MVISVGLRFGFSENPALNTTKRKSGGVEMIIIQYSSIIVLYTIYFIYFVDPLKIGTILTSIRHIQPFMYE